MFALGYQEQQAVFASQEASLKAGLLGQSESPALFAMTVADSSPESINVHLNINYNHKNLRDSLQPQGTLPNENSG